MPSGHVYELWISIFQKSEKKQRQTRVREIQYIPRGAFINYGLTKRRGVQVLGILMCRMLVEKFQSSSPKAIEIAEESTKSRA